jgi:Flp pilus assembly protein TadB
VPVVRKVDAAHKHAQRTPELERRANHHRRRVRRAERAVGVRTRYHRQQQQQHDGHQHFLFALFFGMWLCAIVIHFFAMWL